ncbi:zinc finger BED domain-containing protein 4-like [Dysidea avara]|uniref:zinc finger BED domain-containing protein 4-like n=1 Tax=Dysidea avara TaxID=196820 RepID=UPI00331736E4
MASNTESDLEDEVEDVTEEVGRDVIIVESVNAKGKSKESAVWLYFEKMEERLERTGSHRVANCKECGKGIKVVKGNTSNLMSHLKTKHSKIYEEVRRKTDEKHKSKQSSSQSSVLKRHAQQSLPGMAAKKTKLDSNSVLHKKITRGIAGRHTGVNIASCLKQILRDFTIDQAAVSAVITDNASNMDLASRLGEWNSRHCFGHTLQLAIDDGIKMSPGIREMIKSTKAIVAFYNRSTKDTERLTELQEQLSLPKHKLLSDYPTRWNSTYYMLTRLLEQKPAITIMCASSAGPRLRKNVIDDDETQVPDDYDETQVPESQGSSVPTSEESQQVVVGLIASIKRRWLNHEEDRIYSICTLLDPRFKEVCFTNAALVRAKRLLLSMMRALTQGDSVTSSASVVNDDQEDVPIKKKECLLDSFDELKKKKSTDLSTNQDKDEKELSLYCSAEYIDRKENPLGWWKGNKSHFPTLARIAREYLAIPAMSTPSAKLLSAAGYISSQRRSRLSGENLNQLVFLNKNL